MSTLVPISQLPQGVVPTISALRAISASTLVDGATVQTLGSGAVNDGFQSCYTWSGACGLSDNGFTIIKVSTGAWVRSPQDAPLVATQQAVSYSGIGENFVLLSGTSAQIKYCLPPSYIMFGEPVLIKMLGTGSINIQATGADTIFPANASVAVTNFTVQSSGSSYNLLPYNGVWYQV